MAGKYSIAIHWSIEDNAFISEMPALTGCVADRRATCMQFYITIKRQKAR